MFAGLLGPAPIVVDRFIDELPREFRGQTPTGLSERNDPKETDSRSAGLNKRG